MGHAQVEPGLHAVDALRSALRVPPALASRGEGWRDVTACLWRTPWISSYELAASEEIIVAMHTGGRRSVRTRTLGGWSASASSPGHLHVVPARHGTAFKPEGELEFVSIHLGNERLRRIRDGAERPDLPFRFAFHDDFVGACVRALCDEMHSPRERGALFVDSVTDSLALHILRPPAPRNVSGRGRETLSRQTLSRICERIEASLEEGVSLDDLAAEARLSRYHFARAFRAATGVPPHRYLTLRRIEHAKHLLAHTELPLAEIALSVGFSSQSHFTMRFREAVGDTPRRYREKA